MAKESPISYLPGDDPETVKANLEYQQALANLTASLDARKNRLFDPALASFAAAMLEPGHGGSFGEALGRGIGAYSQAETAEQKLAQEEAAKRVELARMGIELQRQRGSDEFAQTLMGGKKPAPGGALAAAEPTPTAPTAPPQPAGAPVPPLAAAAPRAPDSRSFKIVEPSGVPITREQFMALYLRQHPGDYAGAIEAADKRGDRIKVQQGYTFNPDTGEYTIPPGQPPVDFTFNGKTYKVDPADAFTLNRLRTSGDPRFASEAQRITTGLMSEDERKAAEVRATKAAEKGTEQEYAERGDIRAAGKEAGSTLAFTKTIRTLANDKEAPQIFGVLTTNRPLDQVATILDKGVMGIRIQGLEDALRNSGLSPEGIAKARLAAQQFNQLQIKLAASAKGAVSDYERSLFAEAALSLKDPVQAIHMKNDMLEAKAAFDRNVAKLFRKSGMDADAFREESPAYQREYELYLDRLQKIASGMRLTPAETKSAPSGAPLSVDELRKRLQQARKG